MSSDGGGINDMLELAIGFASARAWGPDGNRRWGFAGVGEATPGSCARFMMARRRMEWLWCDGCFRESRLLDQPPRSAGHQEFECDHV